jgi:ACR3 family arsenite efflux pump ArsB
VTMLSTAKSAARTAVISFIVGPLLFVGGVIGFIVHSVVVGVILIVAACAVMGFAWIRGVQLLRKGKKELDEANAQQGYRLP